MKSIMVNLAGLNVSTTFAHNVSFLRVDLQIGGFYRGAIPIFQITELRNLTNKTSVAERKTMNVTISY